MLQATGLKIVRHSIVSKLLVKVFALFMKVMCCRWQVMQWQAAQANQLDLKRQETQQQYRDYGFMQAGKQEVRLTIGQGPIALQMCGLLNFEFLFFVTFFCHIGAGGKTHHWFHWAGSGRYTNVWHDERLSMDEKMAYACGQS